MPELKTYSDLQDLPCILILCEKGKMGDTFPKSLRFYDLRLRYTNPDQDFIRAPIEQDLGRGFCYVSGEDPEYPVPVILLSEVCFRKLNQGRRLELLTFLPDDS